MSYESRMQFNSSIVESSSNMDHINVEELHVRTEFRNMRAAEKLGPARYGGDLVVICFRGAAQRPREDSARRSSPEPLA